MSISSQGIGGAVGRVVRRNAGDLRFKPWMVFTFLKCAENSKMVSNLRLKECQNTKIFHNQHLTGYQNTKIIHNQRLKECQNAKIFRN